MAADEADEKIPEPDPWADIMADDLSGGLSADPGGDSGGESDDASAFEFLGMEDDSAAPAADPFGFSADDPSADGLAVADFSAADAAVGMGADDPGGEGFPAADAFQADLMQGSPVVGEPNAFAPVNGDPVAADAAVSDEALSDEALSDALVEELFADATPDADAPALSVFVPEESAVHQPSPSTIDIGTGFSGMRLDEAEAAEYEAFAAENDPEAAADADVFDVAAESAGVPAAGAAVAVANAATGRGVPPAGSGRGKKGGIGQLLGIVLGGLMAIPVVLGILVGLMWLGGPDSLGLRKSMPAALAFLLPPKPAAGPATPVAVASDGGSAEPAASLDDVALAAASLQAGSAEDGDPPTDGTAAPVPTDTASVTGDLPMPDELPGLESAGVPDAAIPDASAGAPPAAAVADASVAEGGPPSDAGVGPDETALAAALARPNAAGIDDFDAAVLGESRPEPGAAADGSGIPGSGMPGSGVEPGPLDTSALDAALVAADEAFAAVAGIDDLDDRAGRRRLIDWYRSLARVAEECTRLERVAADSARPLAGAPERVVDLHARIAADGQLAEQVARLGPMWLAFDRRDSEGVMLVAEFAGSRAVGPWWLSTVAHAGDDGARREWTIVSRAEPTVAVGEPVIVTGVIFGNETIWASDCRSARDPRPHSSGAADAPADDPFGASGF